MPSILQRVRELVGGGKQRAMSGERTGVQESRFRDAQLLINSFMRSAADENFAGIDIIGSYNAFIEGWSDYGGSAIRHAQEMRDKDGSFAGAWAQRQAMLFRRDWAIEAADENASDLLARDVFDWAIENLTSDDPDADFHRPPIGGFHQAREGILNGILDGYSVSEIVWAVETFPGNGKPYIIPKRVLNRYPGRFSFNTQRQLLFREEEDEVMPAGKFLTLVHDARYGNPYGFGLAFKCRYWYFFKKSAVSMQLQFTERHHLPFFVASKTEGGQWQESDRDAILAAIAGFKDGDGLTLDGNETLEKFDVTSGRDIHKALIDICNSEMATVILGNPRAIGMDASGTYGAQKASIEFANERIEADGRLEMLTWQDLIRYFMGFNFPEGQEHPRFLIDLSRDVDKEADAKVIEAMVRMGASPGYEWTFEHFGIPVPAEDERTLELAIPTFNAPAGATQLVRERLREQGNEAAVSEENEPEEFHDYWGEHDLFRTECAEARMKIIEPILGERGRRLS